MNTLLENYAKTIVNDLLCLRPGDALSVNTEECDFDFARTVANTALETTCTTVKIVQTIDGRPSEVIDFDPEFTKALQPSGYAMLRIAHIKQETEQGKTFEVIVEKDDLRSIQKLGHLAEPVVLNRRISVPWATVPFYDANDTRWEKIENFVNSKTSDLVMLADYRKNYLNHADIDSLRIRTDSTDLELSIPEDSVFKGGSASLPSGRKFVSGVDFEVFDVNTDCNTVNGTACGKAKILGKTYDLILEFKDGMVVKHSPCPDLDKLFAFDANLRKVGYITLGDKLVKLHLGGALTDCLEETEELPSWFNDCLYTVELELEGRTNITFTDCSDKEKELIRKGLFLE